MPYFQIYFSAVPDAVLLTYPVSTLTNALLQIVYVGLNFTVNAIVSWLVALYLAKTWQETRPDYARLPSRSSSFDRLAALPKKDVVLLFSVSCLIMVYSYTNDHMLVYSYVGIAVLGNVACFHYACRLWLIRHHMERETRRDLTRIAQWAWLSVLAYAFLFFAPSAAESKFKSPDTENTFMNSDWAKTLHSDDYNDILYVSTLTIYFQALFLVHLAQVCVWAWPYERTLQRKVKDER